jgi:hypothetical protein
MLWWDGVETAVMMVLVVEMMVMMITMKSSSMAVRMTMISPLREGIFPVDFSLPERFSPSLVLCPVGAAEYFSRRTTGLRFRGVEIREGASSEVGQDDHTIPRCGLRWARA